MNFDSISQETLDRLREDRKQIQDQIKELQNEIKSINDNRKKLIYSKSIQKLFESLNKNNDSLIKVLSILDKRTPVEEDDEEFVFDQLQEEQEEIL